MTRPDIPPEEEVFAITLPARQMNLLVLLATVGETAIMDPAIMPMAIAMVREAAKTLPDEMEKATDALALSKIRLMEFMDRDEERIDSFRQARKGGRL